MQMNILVTLNRGYLGPLQVMLRSLVQHNSQYAPQLYILHSSLTDEDLSAIAALLPGGEQAVHAVFVEDALLADAPTSSRYPTEMYYRIFAARYLPQELERILYLDPDMVIRGDLWELYNTQLGDCYFAAASHVGQILQWVNAQRLQTEENAPYINSGVLLMNLPLLRREQDEQEVFSYIRDHRSQLLLPDQDIITALYSDRILPLNPYRYNMTERMFLLHYKSTAWLDLDWVRNNSAIIHYCGRNKPWKEHYFGVFDTFYHEAAEGLAL